MSELKRPPRPQPGEFAMACRHVAAGAPPPHMWGYNSESSPWVNREDDSVVTVNRCVLCMVCFAESGGDPDFLTGVRLVQIGEVDPSTALPLAPALPPDPERPGLPSAPVAGETVLLCAHVQTTSTNTVHWYSSEPFKVRANTTGAELTVSWIGMCPSCHLTCEGEPLRLPLRPCRLSGHISIEWIEPS